MPTPLQSSSRLSIPQTFPDASTTPPATCAVRFANGVADKSPACGMSNQAFLPPTSTIVWTPIRNSRTSRMSMAMGNGETWAAYSTDWAQYNTTPMHEHKGYDFETPPVCQLSLPTSPRIAVARLGHLNIDDGHASHDNWRLYATSHSDRR
jgi:hypothetical protein